MQNSCRRHGGNSQSGVKSIHTWYRHTKRAHLYFSFATFLLVYAFAPAAMAVIGQGGSDATHLYTVSRRIHLRAGSEKDKQMLRNVPSVKFLLSESFEVAYEDLTGNGSTDVILLSTASDFCGSAGCEAVVLEKHGASYVTLLDENIPGELAITKERVDGYPALAALDQSGQIAVGNIPGTPAFGHQFVYPMAPPAKEMAASASTFSPKGSSLPSLHFDDLSPYSCIGYDFLEGTANAADPASRAKSRQCDDRTDLNFVSALTASDLDHLNHPLGTALLGGKGHLKYFECRSAGLSAAAVKEIYFFSALLARKANSTVDQSTCRVIVHEESTHAGNVMIRNVENSVQFFHSPAVQEACLEKNRCTGISVSMTIMGSLGVQEDYTEIYRYNMGHIFMGICTSRQANKLRPCVYQEWKYGGAQ